MLIGKYVYIKTLSSHRDTWKDDRRGVKAMTLSVMNNIIYVATTRGDIELWDIVSRKRVFTLRGSDKLVICLCLSLPSNRLFSGSGFPGKTITVWDTEILQCLHTLEGHTNSVTSLILDESINRLYSASYIR